MELTTVVCTYAKGDAIAEQVLAAPMSKGAPSEGHVCLMRGKPSALDDGRSEVTYVYNPKDPRQVAAKERAEQERVAQREKQGMEVPA